ncbi:MAG: SUMF1/EgtB/PvdO family nonheme iron enzyme [Treponema sp.]|nr:SUMF1/EgtB/PvdO family nonheme iron enzyme [Treponema sp.]
MREKQPENEDQVKLKHYFGIRPGVYLTVIYSIVLLIIIFFFLIFPGIKNPGSVIIVKTDPAGAAIRVNNVYMGLSGSKIFVPKGTQTITVVMPGFESQSAVHQIPSRVFGSLFFPRRVKMEFTLKTDNPAAAFAYYAADFASWTFAGEPSSTWQIPLSLSEGAYRVGSYANTHSVKKELQGILKAASRFTVTQASMRDLIRAKILIDNNGSAPTPLSIFNSISDTINFLSENPGSAYWLSELMSSNSAVAAAIESSNWYSSSSAEPLSSGNLERRNLRQQFIGGLNFIGIPGNNYMISDTPVNTAIFETFLNENPQWRDHKTDYFPEEITLDPMELLNRDAVSGITWYAAQAFCEWFTTRLPLSMANMEVRLPTEDEWILASFYIENMRDVTWEWCADYYAPLRFINAPSDAIKLVGSRERSIRGRALPPSTETRAFLPPDLSSPFVTFRIVYAEKE